MRLDGNEQSLLEPQNIVLIIKSCTTKYKARAIQSDSEELIYLVQ